MKILFVSLLLATSLGAQERFVGLHLETGPYGTNSLTLKDGEVATLVSFPTVANNRGLWFSFDGTGWGLYQDAGPLVIVGPAVVQLRGNGGYAAFSVKPNVFAADKTIVVPSGAGGGSVQMEVSTDLVHWTTSTNGVFTNQPATLFFRIHLERISGPP